MNKILIMIIFVLVVSHNAIAQKTSFQTLNIMDDFWTFWDKAETADQPTKTKLFREIVIDPHKEIYDGFTGSHSDDELAGYLKAVTPLVPRMRKITQKLDKELPEQVANFKKTFPDMDWAGTVVFLPNFGVTDSGGGLINGKPYQMFGVDTIAVQYGENADLSVLFSHELFHLYFGQFHPELGKNREKGEIPLYWLVWNEGLATYASQRLHPKTSIEQIFLGQNVKSDVEPKLPKLARKILDNFDNGSPDIWKPFMSDGNNEIPTRSGYYVGFKIARELGKKMSLRKLAQLKGDDLQKKMKSILVKFAKHNIE
jgi:Putative zinc dependent peptidase (DUF5700)